MHMPVPGMAATLAPTFTNRLMTEFMEGLTLSKCADLT